MWWLVVLSIGSEIAKPVPADSGPLTKLLLRSQCTERTRLLGAPRLRFVWRCCGRRFAATINQRRPRDRHDAVLRLHCRSRRSHRRVNMGRLPVPADFPSNVQVTIVPRKCVASDGDATAASDVAPCLLSHDILHSIPCV